MFLGVGIISPSYQDNPPKGLYLMKTSAYSLVLSARADNVVLQISMWSAASEVLFQYRFYRHTNEWTSWTDF